MVLNNHHMSNIYESLLQNSSLRHDALLGLSNILALDKARDIENFHYTS